MPAIYVSHARDIVHNFIQRPLPFSGRLFYGPPQFFLPKASIMKLKPMGRTGLRVTELCFGAMT